MMFDGGPIRKDVYMRTIGPLTTKRTLVINVSMLLLFGGEIPKADCETGD